jgi:membrane protein YdbS with pleckstrin-like domain
MDPTEPASPATPDAPVDAAATWQGLPVAARTLFTLSGAALAIPAALAARVFAGVFELAWPWATTAIAAILAGGWAAWLGHRRYRYTRWRLDADGFSLRKGRLWQSDIRVPVNRVQHLDLRRGPLERRYGLATLVIHTAGTRDSAVNVGGLADADAEALRDLLARQAEHDRLHAS